jgi:VCBS repeat-containing protein
MVAVAAIPAAALGGLPTASTSTLASPTQISHVCVNKSSGQLFYLASCTKSQAKTDVSSSTSLQFKACYQASNGVTRKVPESTKCSNKTTNKEITIEKVPADSSSLYFCVKSSDRTMYFKGTTEPTCPTGQYAVVIGPHNQAPSAVGDSYSTDEDTTLNVSAPGVLTNDSDQDGDTITAQVATGPSHGTLTLNSDGSFSYKPNADYNGPDSFTYKAKDSHNTLSVAATVSITVNAAPVAEDDSKTVAEDSGQTTIDVLANDTDLDGGTKQIASAGNPEHGTVVVAGDNLSLSYEPDDNYCGQDTFSYTLNGGSTANVAVTVDCVNDPPGANDDSATVDEGGTVGGNVLTNDTDSDGDALKAVLVSGPAHDSSFDLNPDGSFSYTHDGGDTTSDSFTYKASDGTADSTVATATITVLPPDAQCKTLASKTLGSSFNPSNYNFHGGTADGDTFTGTDGQSEVFCGFGGNDALGTLQAGDIFLGGDGQDMVNTNNGTFYGDAGDDRVGASVRGYDNNGTFYGGDGNDQVPNRNDGTFNGDAGDDYVEYTQGTFNGGDGNDQARENAGTFNGDAGDDSVRFGNSATFNGGAGNDYVISIYGNSGTFNGGDGNDSVTTNFFFRATFNGGDGNDSVTTNTDRATFNGGAGDDSVTTNEATFNGGDDTDSVTDNFAFFNGDAGDDSVTTNYANATFNGGDGNDSVGTNNGTFVQ